MLVEWTILKRNQAVSIYIDAVMTLTVCFLLSIISINLSAAARRQQTNGTWMRMGLLLDDRMQNDRGFPSCKSLPGLSAGQRRLCQLYVDHMSAVAFGAKHALTECKHQFRSRRWNCSILNDADAFGPVISIASRESAFAHALASAGVTHAISRACRDGQLTSCGCSRTSRPKNLKKEWVWGGCGDNLEYGYKFTQSFVDVRERERKFKRGTREQGRVLMNLHNNEAGRRALIKKSKVTCKCHGVSGSCSLITCWQQLASFREVGDYLRDKYDGATEVRVNRRGRLQLLDPRVTIPTAYDLVYLEDSPNYCVKDEVTGSLGTQGRVCNRTSPDIDGCNLLCCGRGYNTLKTVIKERCQCKFKWCCQVECKTCSRTLDVHTCKLTEKSSFCGYKHENEEEDLACQLESVGLSKRKGRGGVDSGLTHECGVFGAIGCGEWPTNLEISQIICWGLVAVQHRGQESAGIVTSEGKCSKSFNVVKGMGMISNIFNDEAIRKLKGSIGIGHTRYSTSAASEEVNCQPFVVHTAHGALAVAHNGELVNCDSLRRQVLEHGVGLSTHSDSELITQALCLNPPEGEPNGEPDWPARIKHFMALAPLSYSLVIMLKNKIYAVRDPYGNRPLCLGKILPFNEPLDGDCDESREAEGWVVSSESCGFLSIGAQYVREVFPGEIIEMTRHGVRTIDVVSRPEDKLQQAFCIFEYVYFARADSIFEGQMVYAVRMQCGKQLAIEHPVEADIVGAVPESGNAAAHGFSRQSGIRFAEVLCKNRYVGRSFIQPSNRLRQLSIAKKFGALAGNVKGKKVVLIDDSIVRGNTIGPIIKLLKNAGAKEVHIRVASPPLKYPCYMGINIPTREELIANKMTSHELARHVGADSLEYLSLEGLIKAVRSDIKTKNAHTKVGHCTACLSGIYPGGVPNTNSDFDW